MKLRQENYSFRAEKSRALRTRDRLYSRGKRDRTAEEKKILTAGIYGQGVDFFTVKGAVQQVLSQLHINKVKIQALHRCTVVSPRAERLAFTAATHISALSDSFIRRFAKNYGINTEVYAFEIDMNSLYDCRGGVSEYKPVPGNIPRLQETFSLCLQNEVYSGDIEEKDNEKAGRPLLESIKVFDVYTGLQVAHGYKSIAYALFSEAPTILWGTKRLTPR